MVRILVIGGNGFIGLPLMRALRGRGHDVFCLHRGGAGRSSARADHIIGDRTDGKAVRSIVRSHGFEVVVDMIAMTLESTAPLFEALSGEIYRYVLISSADVYRNYEGLQKKATPDPTPDLLDENAPLRESRYPYRDSEISKARPELLNYDKIPIEDALQAQTGFDWSIARLCMIFGPGDRQRRFSSFIQPMNDRRPVLLIEEGWAAWRSTFGFVDDIAEGLARIASEPVARNRIYNVGMANPLTRHDVAAALKRACGWKGDIRIVGKSPDLPPHIGGYADNLDLSYHLGVDTTRIRTELGYSEKRSFDEVLSATVADEAGRGRPSGLEGQYAAEDAYLAR